MTQPSPSGAARPVPRWLKPLTDYGPLAAFFIAYLRGDLMTATVALMATTAVALALSLVIARKLPLMPLITALVVGLFGGLTLWLHDDTFIKMKPTIVQAVLGAILLAGLLTGRALLKPVLGSAWAMDEVGWRKLTFRFGLFFLAMAGLNEIVWRTQSTDLWVNFKVFGIMLLTMLFALSQTPLLNRHKLPDPETPAPDAER
ncbi:MAG TPA: septation protein A [Alphaproteobacteria bacterium]|jgi:intracellular septation protein